MKIVDAKGLFKAVDPDKKIGSFDNVTNFRFHTNPLWFVLSILGFAVRMKCKDNKTTIYVTKGELKKGLGLESGFSVETVNKRLEDVRKELKNKKPDTPLPPPQGSENGSEPSHSTDNNQAENIRSVNEEKAVEVEGNAAVDAAQAEHEKIEAAGKTAAKAAAEKAQKFASRKAVKEMEAAKQNVSEEPVSVAAQLVEVSAETTSEEVILFQPVKEQDLEKATVSVADQLVEVSAETTSEEVILFQPVKEQDLEKAAAGSSPKKNTSKRKSGANPTEQEARKLQEANDRADRNAKKLIKEVEASSPKKKLPNRPLPKPGSPKKVK